MNIKQQQDNKIILENILKKKITTFFNKIVKDFGIELLSNSILNANKYIDDLQSILTNHYKSVYKVFGRIINNDLPKNLQLTKLENDILNSVMMGYFAERVVNVSRIVTNTTNKEINSSINRARSDLEVVTEKELSLLATTYLKRNFNSRIPLIAVNETQIPTEESKQKEVITLAGNKSNEVLKQYITAGDELVRPAHASANKQKVLINQPYLVGGDLMMFPADQSLGASASNTYGCRCSSISDEQQIIAIRRQAFFEDLLEV